MQFSKLFRPIQSTRGASSPDQVSDLAVYAYIHLVAAFQFTHHTRTVHLANDTTYPDLVRSILEHGSCPIRFLPPNDAAYRIRCTANILDAGMRTVHELARSGEPDNEVVAAGLDNHRLQGEDRLVLIGSPFYPDSAFPYYVLIGRLLVVEQIPDADEFWGLP
jgi:hypothetical protein